MLIITYYPIVRLEQNLFNQTTFCYYKTCCIENTFIYILSQLFFLWENSQK